MNRIFVSILWITLTYSLGFAQTVAEQNPAKLNLIVTDKSNKLIVDLRKEKITLSIDGKSQTVLSLEQEELPLIYALAIDSSGSMRPIFGDILNSAKSVVSENQMEDETMLLSFISRDKIKTTQNFSSDRSFLAKIIDTLAVEGGQTAVIDAIYMAVKKVAEHKKDDGKIYRRAVVVITDGEDRDSSYTEKQLLELIRKENVQVFFIGLVNELESQGGFVAQSSQAKATKFIKKVTQESGGAAIFPKKIKDLPEAANQIVQLLRVQYSISYTPLSDEKNKPRKIEVKLGKDSKRKDLKFYFRSSNKEK